MYYVHPNKGGFFMENEKEELELLEKLRKINEEITEEDIKNASKEEILEYLKLIDKIKAITEVEE